MSKRLPKYKIKAKQRLTLYHKVVKSTLKELNSSGIIADYASARKFASTYVYGNFKGQNAKKVKVDEIRKYTKEIIEQLSRVPKPIEFADPRMIGEQEVSGINWFDLDDYLSTEIRSLYALSGGKDLRVEVLAGDYGRSGEFNLSDYEYVSTGIRDIIEKIRQDSPYVTSEPYPYWEGYYGLRAGKKDDGDVDSYVLQIILVEGGQPVVAPQSIETLPPSEVISEEEFKRRNLESQKRLKEEQERQKARKQAEKMRKRKEAKRPTKKVKVKEAPKPEEAKPEKEEKADKTTRGKQVLQLNEQKLKELELLRRDLDDKIISKAEYKKERDRVMRNYEEALKKMKRGGVV